MKRYKTVDDYIAGAEQWQDEFKLLAEILQSTELTEEVKWRGPCYTFEGKKRRWNRRFQVLFRPLVPPGPFARR